MYKDELLSTKNKIKSPSFYIICSSLGIKKSTFGTKSLSLQSCQLFAHQVTARCRDLDVFYLEGVWDWLLFLFTSLFLIRPTVLSIFPSKHLFSTDKQFLSFKVLI